MAELDALQDVAWYIDEHKLEDKKCEVWFLEKGDPSKKVNQTKIGSALDQTVQKASSFMKNSIDRCVENLRKETNSEEYGLINEGVTITTGEDAYTPKDPDASLQYWATKKDVIGYVEKVPKENLHPTLRVEDLKADVSFIAKSKNSKPVSALEASCTTSSFVTEILKEEKNAPHIVCSGSTLSQILNWLMKLSYNCDRPLICFQKLNNGTIWAHCLYENPNEVPTTQSKEGLEFSSSVEEFFLKDVPENVYKFASSPMKFGELNLLTYFEVDGFLKDEPLEIKSQKTTDTFLQRSSATSIANSYQFSVKKHFRYLHYQRADLIADNTGYKITAGGISESLLGTVDNNVVALKQLYAILRKVQTTLKDENTPAVILQFIYATENIHFLKVAKNGGKVDDSWMKELEIKPEEPKQKEVEDEDGFKEIKSNKQKKPYEPKSKKAPGPVKESKANEIRTGSIYENLQEENKSEEDE
jgi:hypothetical protein